MNHPFIKPFTLSPNPRSRTLVQNFIDSNLNEAEVDTTWSVNPRRVYEKLHRYLRINKHLGIMVRFQNGTVILYKE